MQHFSMFSSMPEIPFWPQSRKSSSSMTPSATKGVGLRSYSAQFLPRSREIPGTASAFSATSSSLSSQQGTTTTLLSSHFSDAQVPTIKNRVFFLDVNSICYEGSRPSLHFFAHWISLFFFHVSLSHPVVAVLDGHGGNDYRRKLLPSYKAHRTKFWTSGGGRTSINETVVVDLLEKCSVPVVKVNGYEADDVIATLMDQVLQRGFRVVIGSPDKDFKQLISEDVQIVMPMPELGRWSFYTLKHYIAQYNCEPSCDLSLRCILGDVVDGVPGIQQLAPGFGRKTALKLLKQHGSLDNLLNTAAIRTVAKSYAQDALTKHADHLRKNYKVLSLRRDAKVHLEEAWLHKRDLSKDTAVLSNFMKTLDRK